VGPAEPSNGLHRAIARALHYALSSSEES